MRTLLLLALAPGATAVGWSQFRAVPIEAAPQPQWAKANNLLWRFFAARHVAGRADRAPRRVHGLRGRHGRLYGVNSDGTFGWYLRIDKGVVNSAAAVSTKHNLVVFGGMNGGIYGVGEREPPRSGRSGPRGPQKGSRTTPYIHSSPVISNDDALRSSAPPAASYAVELASGDRVKWIFDAKGEPVWSSPALSADQKTVVGGIDNFVRCPIGMRQTRASGSGRRAASPTTQMIRTSTRRRPCPRGTAWCTSVRLIIGCTPSMGLLVK